MIEYKTFTGKELYDFLIDYNKENPFEILDTLEEEIKYFGDITPSFRSDEEFIFFCALDNNYIIGASKLKLKGESVPSIPLQTKISEWISFISVNPKYQNQGIAGELIKMTFEYLYVYDFKKVIVSGYSKLGLKHLRPRILFEAKKYDIQISDADKVEF